MFVWVMIRVLEWMRMLMMMLLMMMMIRVLERARRACFYILIWWSRCECDDGSECRPLGDNEALRIELYS